MTRVKTSRCFALSLEKSRLHVDSKSYSTSTGFADVVTWRNSSSSIPDFLLSGSRWPPPSGLEYKADPHVPLHMTINPSCDRFPLGWILLKRSYIERRWVFFFFFFLFALLFDSPGQRLTDRYIELIVNTLFGAWRGYLILIECMMFLGLAAGIPTSHRHLPPSIISPAAWPIPPHIHLWEWPWDVAVFLRGLPQFANLPNPGDFPSWATPNNFPCDWFLGQILLLLLLLRGYVKRRWVFLSLSLCCFVWFTWVKAKLNRSLQLLQFLVTVTTKREESWNDQRRIKKCLILNCCRPTICLCGYESQPGCKEQPGRTLLEVSHSNTRHWKNNGKRKTNDLKVEWKVQHCVHCRSHLIINQSLSPNPSPSFQILLITSVLLSFVPGVVFWFTNAGICSTAATLLGSGHDRIPHWHAN